MARASAVSVLLGLCTSCGDVGGPVTGLIFGKVLQDFMDRIDQSISKAANHGDYLAEKAGRQAQLLIRNGEQAFSDQLDKSFDRLSKEHQIFWQHAEKLTKELEDLRGDVLKLEDFVALDLQNIINQMPFKQDVYLLRRVDGYGQVYRDDGSYTFGLIGNAFGPGFNLDCTIGDYTVPLSRIRNLVAHTAEFDVPSSKLNQLFSDDEVRRVRFKIVCTKPGDKSPVFAIENQMLLLPKFPVSCQVEETYTSTGFASEKRKSPMGTKRIGATGRQGFMVADTVTTSIPAGSKMDKGSVKVWANRDFGEASHAMMNGPITFSDGDLTVTAPVKHQVHDNFTDFYITVDYWPSARSEATRTVDFDDASKSSHRLSFGKHFAVLSEGHRLYRVRGQFFNGAKFTVSTESAVDGQVSATLATGGGSNRLLLEVRAPN